MILTKPDLIEGGGSGGDRRRGRIKKRKRRSSDQTEEEEELRPVCLKMSNKMGLKKKKVESSLPFSTVVYFRCVVFIDEQLPASDLKI